MFKTMQRMLLILSVFLSSFVLAAADPHALYEQIAPQLLGARERLASACVGGDPDACQSLKNLDEVLSAFENADTACQAGEVTACRELGVGVGLLLVGSRCERGDALACQQLHLIESLAPACDAGDEQACRQIESLLFGSSAG